MKLLLLDPTYRTWLNSRLALSLDGDLNEKLIGLTYEESVFFVELSNPPFTSFEGWESDILTRFMEMHERHERVLAFRAAARSFMPSD